MSDNGVSDKNIQNSRFSDEESLLNYTGICYSLTKEERKIHKITSIGGYCRCMDKTKCDCLHKIKEFFRIK